MASATPDLDAAFKSHCDKEATEEMTSRAFCAWCKDSKLFGVSKSMNSNHADICFSKCAKGKKNIRSDDMDNLCKEMATVLIKDKQMDEAAAITKVKDILGKYKKQPKAASKSNRSVDDRLTDTSKYTGAHKSRFDAKGKGKGIEGREERAENTGYVGNYKGGDTYDKSH